MTFIRMLVLNYIEQRLEERNNFTDRIFINLRMETLRIEAQPSYDEAFLHKVLRRLNNCSKDFNQKYNDLTLRCLGLTDKILDTLRKRREDFYEEYQEALDGLFADPVGWVQVFVFLEYNAQLVNKTIASAPAKTSDLVLLETSELVSHIITCLCSYLEDSLSSWHLEKPESWMGFIKYEDEVHNQYHYSTKQKLGLAAIAAIIGGFYLCSKLSVQ